MVEQSPAQTQPRDLSKIYTGQYVVQPGDSLLKIAMTHKVRTQEIAKVNQLFDDNIFPNQVLKVPQMPGAQEIQQKQKAADEIVKNNQTGTYQIEGLNNDLLSQIEESKTDPAGKRDSRNAVLIQDVLQSDMQGAKDEADNGFSQRQSFRTSAGVDQQKLTDPVESFECVKSHFERIQQNFTNMRQGITQTKTQLSEWVSQASRSQAPPDLNPTQGSGTGANKTDGDIEIIDKKDPILLALEKEKEAFDPEVYISKGAVSGPESLWQTVEVFYQTRMDMIKGNLTFKLDHLSFEALNLKNREQKDTSQFNMMIDYLDIVSVSILKIPNEEAADHPEKFVRTSYRFNFLIQIEVSAINGLSVVDRSVNSRDAEDEQNQVADDPDQESGAIVEGTSHNIVKRSNMSLANIFFKLQHEDQTVMRHLLVNKEQEQVVNLVIEKLQQFVNNAPPNECSLTYIPFYDTVLPMEKRHMLGQVKMSALIQEKVKSILVRSLSSNEQKKATQMEAEQQSAMLIRFRPDKNQDSKLLNDFQISNISEHIGMYRNMKWTLLYRLSDHGVSMNTFTNKLQGFETTLIIIQDSKRYKFGGFCTEEWVFNSGFYGTGENFVFTFGKGDECEMWDASGDNSMYQYCDRTGFGVGGGVSEGRFAMFLGRDLLNGNSFKTECFSNECLASAESFQCIDIEVWGFE